MSVSRRDLLRGAAALAVVAPVVAPAQNQPTDLPEAAKKLLPAAKEGVANFGKARAKTKLPENSEPGFVFVPTPVKGRGA